MTALSYYDTTILSLGALFLGIIMLIKGGNWAIDSAVYIANRYGIHPMVVGFTIIAFGTSLPELVVSVFANLQDAPGIALGNVIGSNIANIAMVLGCTALFIALKVNITKSLIRDIIFMLTATIALAILLNYGEISRMTGFIMIGILGTYVFIQYKSTNADEFTPEDNEEDLFPNGTYAYAALVIGLICIAVGAEFLVKGAQVSAGLVGVPESIVALSLIAFGTSLPELSTSIIAARKGQSDMLIGNIIGSNVFNILMIIGFASIAKPIFAENFDAQLAHFDIWITLVVAMIFTAILMLFGRINRMTGFVFISAYIAYNIYIYTINISV